MRPEEDDNHDFGPDGVYNYDHLKIVNLMVVISGGDKPIERRKLSWTSKSKIGSLEKANHRPGGGQVDISCINFCLYFWRCIYFCNFNSFLGKDPML